MKNLSKVNKIFIFEGKIVCPRCHGNGLIYRGKLSKLDDKIIYICDECESCWEDVSSISKRTFSHLSLFLEKLGFSYDDIINLGYVVIE